MQKMFAGFVILILCAFLLSGCTKGLDAKAGVKDSQGLEDNLEGNKNRDSTQEKGNGKETGEGELGEIQIASFLGSIPMYLNASISAFNGEHDDGKVKRCYEELSGEELWQRVSAEFALGEGPDMIIIPASDERIRTLWEKGLLANLDDYVSADVKEMIFPGIIQSGSVDGNWVGLAWEGMPWVLVTSNDLWESDNWDLGDIEKIVREHPDLEALFINADCYMTKGESTPEVNARFLFGSLEKYIDREKGTCNFENEEFISALKLLKRYGNVTIPREELPAYLKGGKNLATFMRFNYPGEFTNALQNYYTDHCHFVGMVGQQSAVGEWSSVFLILVNIHTKHPESIREFLSLLLEYDQNGGSDATIAVREDIIRNRVRYDENGPEWDGGAGWYYVLGKNELGGMATVSFSGPNGENLIEDYISLLKKLGPYPVVDPIKKIVDEEAENFVESNKTAEEAARVIQNRVQIYLNENQ